MDHFEKFEKQLISSYESTLAAEGSEICKEVESILEDDHELLIEKANSYCLSYTDPKRVDINEEIVKKCRKFLKDFSNYRCIKNNLDCLSKSRKKV